MISHFLRRRGYTLVELLVVITIIGIIVFAGAQLSSSEKIKIQEAENLSLDLVRLLREARTKALSGATIETDDGEEISEEIPAGGYGVFFDSVTNQAYVFADANDDGKFRDELGTEDEILIETDAYFPLLRLMAYRINIVGDTPPEGKVISDTEGDANDFWIIFAPTTGEVTFGCATEGEITADTKEMFLDIILENVRHYHIFLNKVSRFLYLEQMSAESHE